ncbi:MAG: metal ABC transporter ATP-binding protein [Bacilli bacterium]|nr:metal ABC transporter ATP-binding protein [Bacilli bacterium]
MIKTENLTIGYDNEIILKNVNINIKEGEFVCLIGDNGSGKSTLLKTMIGLNKPLSGKIIIDGKASIGYVPQTLQVQPDFPATVNEIVMSGCLKKMKWRPFYTKKERELASKYMKMLQISQFKHRSFSELSGGQQQRVLIARALCATSKVLFLDEPFSALDRYATLKLYGVLHKINRDDNVTVVIISHDVETTLRHATRVVHINETIVFDGTKDEYMQSAFMKDYKGGAE